MMVFRNVTWWWGWGWWWTLLISGRGSPCTCFLKNMNTQTCCRTSSRTSQSWQARCWTCHRDGFPKHVVLLSGIFPWHPKDMGPFLGPILFPKIPLPLPIIPTESLRIPIMGHKNLHRYGNWYGNRIPVPLTIKGGHMPLICWSKNIRGDVPSWMYWVSQDISVPPMTWLMFP